MRIAFVVNNYAPRVGGLEAHVEALASELASRGHYVLVVNLGEKVGWRRDGAVEVLTLGERFKIGGLLGFPLLGTRTRITKVLRERNIDLVSTHTRFFPMSFVGWRAAKAVQLPLIHTEHGSNYVASSSLAIRLGSRLVDHTFGRWTLRGATRVLAVSEEAVNFVRRLTQVEAQVFYNAITPPAVLVEAIQDRPAEFVFVGRVVEGKGWNEFVCLINQLRAAGYPVSGKILGDGPRMDELKELVSRLELNDAVLVCGRVSPGEVRSALRGATLINPTVLSEGFQTTLLEAIAEQGRVLTYPVPGARNLLEVGAPIWITQRRDLESLVSSAKQFLASPPPLATPESIGDWTWPKRSEQYIEICEELLAE
ncbi:glycosyltransferase family 4 protein [Leucobacter sp. W1153]|uniref:glycosyltransferase family 4 protein n=1 Tax=Leucobacter sp. W1153 TaxID=3439064 RepID=UPI003F3E378E